jgi:hypothetical protein
MPKITVKFLKDMLSNNGEGMVLTQIVSEGTILLEDHDEILSGLTYKWEPADKW